MFTFPVGLYSSGYDARGVVLATGGNYMTSSTSMMSDSKLISIVWWHKADYGGSERFFYTLDTGSNRFSITNDSGACQVEGWNSSGTQILRALSNNLAGDGDIWRCLMFSVDLATGASTELYIGDTSELSTTPIFTNDIMELSGGGSPANNFGYTGTFSTSGYESADAWFKSGVALDFSTESVRRNFIGVDGKPKDLGAGGVVAGHTPEIYLSLRPGESPSDYATNKGSGGNFTITGTLTESSTSPSD